EQQAYLRHALIETRPALVDRDAEPGELVRQERARETDFEPSAGNGIEHADLTGKLERMVEHRQHGPGDEPRPRGAHGRRRQEHDRARAVAAVRGEIMLDRAHVGVAQCVAFADERERVLPVRLGRHLARADGGEELDPELHHATNRPDRVCQVALRHLSNTPSPRPKQPWKMICMIIRLTSHPAATGWPLSGNTTNHRTSTGRIAPNRKAAT